MMSMSERCGGASIRDRSSEHYQVKQDKEIKNTRKQSVITGQSAYYRASNCGVRAIKLARVRGLIPAPKAFNRY